MECLLPPTHAITGATGRYTQLGSGRMYVLIYAKDVTLQ
jgi:hypothetical protein